MPKIKVNAMRKFLSQSISSINQNKINGMLAEIDLRKTLTELGFAGRISKGGWIMRNVGNGKFGHKTIVLFPETIEAETDYEFPRTTSDPPIALHTICATMHQIGVHSYYCIPSIPKNGEVSAIEWHIKQLGIPISHPSVPLASAINEFDKRSRSYNFLRYKTNAKTIPQQSISDEFTKEHLRIEFQSKYMCEMSDIDGVIWGSQHTYPIEIKEKTVASDKKIGDYFGLDVGPFVKLAFYAAKKGNLHSLFFVREINNTIERKLVGWWYIRFEILAQFASWVPMGGGRNMQGGGSTVVRIPKAEFMALTKANLETL